TRLKVPVVAEYDTASRGLTLPTARTSVTRIVVLSPNFSCAASGATNTLLGSDAVNFAVVSAVTPSTVAVMRASPVAVLVRLARAMLLPSASMAAGVIWPRLVRNATRRRPAGSSAATLAVTTTAVTPSAGADGSADTTITSAGLLPVNATLNS